MSPTAPFLDIVAARKAFGSAQVLGGVDLTMARGEFVSLLGPSGCGKTTLLRIIAGLLAPDSGSIQLDGRALTALPPHKRKVGVVFQNYALFPHLTAGENVAFGLVAQGTGKAEAAATARRFLELVQMANFADRSVRQLSGGQQQRIAVARALAVHPKLLLLDEPFSALDRKLRETMQIELKRLLRELAITAIFVTHDQDEALVMSDRIAVMNQGHIEQIADPQTIYRRPSTPFVLDFVGLSTRIVGRISSTAAGVSTIQTAYGEVTTKTQFSPGTAVSVCIRPERLKLGSGSDNRITIPFRDATFQGSKALLYFASTEPDHVMLEAADTSDKALTPGKPMTLSWSIDDTLVYPITGAAP